MSDQHECLGCNFIETAPVTLRDGRVVCSSCEDYRFEKEAKMIAELEPVSRRREWLADLQKIRGDISALKAEVAAQFEEKRRSK